MLFFEHVISFVHIYQAFKTSCKNYFSLLTNALLEVVWIRNIWCWRFLLEQCLKRIWFTSKPWKTKPPRNTVFDLFCSFLMIFFSFCEFLWKKDTSLVQYSKMREHGHWVSPPHIQLMELCRCLVSPLGWGGEKGRLQKSSGLTVPKFVRALCEQYW